MSELSNSNYGKTETGSYRRETKATWWLEKSFYRKYMLREASAIFTLLYCLNLIAGVIALYSSKVQFYLWYAAQSNPIMFIIAMISFFSVLYHTITWFSATPKVMPIKIGKKKLNGQYIVRAHWALFILLMIVIIFGLNS